MDMGDPSGGGAVWQCQCGNCIPNEVYACGFCGKPRGAPAPGPPAPAVGKGGGWELGGGGKGPPLGKGPGGFKGSGGKGGWKGSPGSGGPMLGKGAAGGRPTGGGRWGKGGPPGGYPYSGGGGPLPPLPGVDTSAPAAIMGILQTMPDDQRLKATEMISNLLRHGQTPSQVLKLITETQAHLTQRRLEAMQQQGLPPGGYGPPPNMSAPGMDGNHGNAAISNLADQLKVLPREQVQELLKNAPPQVVRLLVEHERAAAAEAAQSTPTPIRDEQIVEAVSCAVAEMQQCVANCEQRSRGFAGSLQTKLQAAPHAASVERQVLTDILSQMDRELTEIKAVIDAELNWQQR